MIGGDIGAPGIWAAAGLVLAIAELFVPGVFLIFLAIAAGITAALAWALPDLPVAAQLGAFGLWSGVAVLIGRRWYRDYPVESTDPRLNDRAARMIGQIATVTTPIRGGEGRARIGDGEWPARGPDAEVGARLRIAHVEGTTVLLEPLSD